MHSLGDRIKLLRRSKNITQNELAEILNISKYSIHNTESKRITSVDPDLIIKVAKHFNVTSDYLLGLSDIRQPDPTADIPEPARSVIRSCIEHLKK